MFNDSKDFALSIRLLNDEDIEPLYQMYMDVEANPYLTFDAMTSQEFEVIFRELAASKSVYIALLNHQVVGSYRIIRKTYRQQHSLYLGSFVVHRDMKGRGIGSKILNNLLYSVANEGIIRVVINSRYRESPSHSPLSEVWVPD